MTEITGSVDDVIGRNLKCIRHLRGMTQKNLADGVGVTFQQIQKYEKGRNRISVSMLIKIAEFMDEHPLSFMDGATKFQGRKPIDSSIINKESLSLLRDYDRISDDRIKSSIKELLCAYSAGCVKIGES